MTAAVVTRFIATAILGATGLVSGGVAGIYLYEGLGDPEGFEALLGGLYGAPPGLFLGACAGNWIARQIHGEGTNRRVRGPVLIESFFFSLGLAVAFLLQAAASPMGDLAMWLVVGLGGIAGFALGVLLADRLTQERDSEAPGAPSDTLGPTDGDRSGIVSPSS